MKRRAFIAGIGSAMAWPLAARAQQSAMPIIGFVNGGSPEGYRRSLASFLRGLSESGYVESRNVSIEYRWAEGQYDRLPMLVDDLVHRGVNVIAATSTPAALVANAVVRTIPVVFTTAGDPVELGLASRLSRPDGNFTGATTLAVEGTAKRIELLHEAVPTATTMALLVNPINPMVKTVLEDSQAAAATLGLKLNIVTAGNEQEFAAIFAHLVQDKTEALVIGIDNVFTNRSKDLAELTVQNRVPAIYQYTEFTTAGGLMSFGGSSTNSWRLAGVYAGRILKGEKPAELPIQQVTKVELIINLKSAKALKLTLPQSLIARADEVIE